MLILHPTKMLSPRREFDLAVTTHGSRCGTDQSGGYTRVVVHSDCNGSEHGSENAVGLHGIAYISLP